MKEQQIKIEKERVHKPYAEHWHASKFYLEHGKSKVEGSYYMFLASLSFSAFTLEAFLNHIGSIIFSCWDDMDRLSPEAKLKVICEKLNIMQNYAELPWQIILMLIRFRNNSVHAKSQYLKESIVVKQKNYQKHLKGPLEPNWMEFVTEKNATEVRENLKKIIEIIHSASNIEDSLFSPGIQIGSASLLEP